MSTFGKSQYGERLDFSNRKCQDPCCAAIYLTHIIGLIYSVFHIYIIEYNEIDSSEWSRKNDINSMNWTGCFVLIPVSIISGLICGIIWLLFIRKLSKYVIQTMMLLNIIVWFACFIVGLATFNLGVLISGIIISVLFAIQYTWFAFYRISFSAQILVLGNHIINDYFIKRDRSISLIIAISILLDIAWLFLWASSFYGYIIVMTEIDNVDPLGWVIFLYLLSLYWGLSVNANINHTILCAVIASWYFSPKTGHNITGKVIINALTKQYGSICLGASLVPLIEAINAFFDAFVAGDPNSVVECVCLCCTNCLQYLLTYFNTYSFVFMGIYGDKFIKSSAKINKLIQRRGLNTILIDDITGVSIFCASLVCGVITSAVSYGIAFLFYGHDPDINISIYLPAELAIFGGIIGLILCLDILRIVRSAIIALWVCFADNPSVLEVNRPKCFKKLTHSHSKMQSLNMRIIISDTDDDNTDIDTDVEATQLTTKS